MSLLFAAILPRELVYKGDVLNKALIEHYFHSEDEDDYVFVIFEIEGMRNRSFLLSLKNALNLLGKLQGESFFEMEMEARQLISALEFFIQQCEYLGIGEWEINALFVKWFHEGKFNS